MRWLILLKLSIGPAIAALTPAIVFAANGIYFTADSNSVGAFYTAGKLLRAEFDGSNPRTIIGDITMTLAVDPAKDRLYYINTDNLNTADIGQSDLNGENRQRLAERFSRYSGGIDVDPDTDRLFIGFGTHAYSMDVDQPFPLQPIWNGLSGVADIEYAGSLGRIFLTNNTSSGGGDGVWSIVDQTFAATRVVHGLQDLFGVAVDPGAGHLFYAARSRVADPRYIFNRVIYQSDLDGSNEVVLIDMGSLAATQPRDIEVVPEMNAIFWTDQLLGGVWRAKLDGSNPRRIIEYPATVNLKVIVPEPHSAAMIVIGALGAGGWRLIRIGGRI
jgi:hypothetical protein